jgi:hypothetical protein
MDFVDLKHHNCQSANSSRRTQVGCAPRFRRAFCIPSFPPPSRPNATALRLVHELRSLQVSCMRFGTMVHRNPPPSRHRPPSRLLGGGSKGLWDRKSWLNRQKWWSTFDPDSEAGHTRRILSQGRTNEKGGLGARRRFVEQANWPSWGFCIRRAATQTPIGVSAVPLFSRPRCWRAWTISLW